MSQMEQGSKVSGENVSNKPGRSREHTKKGKRQKFDHKAKYGQKEKRTVQMSAEINRLKQQYAQIDSSKIESFRDFPLSQKTLKGLKDGEYEDPTEIQRESIGLALKGHDILGAAKTGSGKTLAFLIPVLELLFRVRWTSVDGMGALIISPTRELAYQTFEVLKNIGQYHDFSAGLVIGGKHVREEAERINTTNIIVCTPGRLLQHMDETVNFTADNLQILVLDEADRILDLGFAPTMNAILENLPPKRQTLLFSATQTKSIKDLARLSLKDPMYVSVHEHAKHSTPARLEQSYIVCELHEKLNVLWSFVKNHLKAKVLVFLSSCKQVRFVYEVFRRMRPGVTVMALHGAMPQMKRMASYDQFCRKEFCVLFATDIAARGLDFPEVNWVVQYDCPEDAHTYIHRAGRTARYQDDGEALLMLSPSEEKGMLKQLVEAKIPINKIKVNSKKLGDLKAKLQSLLASDVTLKEYAQRAFVSYVKSVFLMKNKEVFNVNDLDTDAFALSLGLAIPPRVRFLQKEEKRRKEAKKKLKLDADSILEMFKSTAKPAPGSQRDKGDSADEEDQSTGETSEAESSSSEDESGSESSSEEESEPDKNVKTKANKGKKSKPEQGDKLNFDIGNDDIDDILTVKSVAKLDDIEEVQEEPKEPPASVQSNLKRSKVTTKAKLAKKVLKKQLKINSKVTFDDEGEAVEDMLKKPQIPLAKEEETYEGGINIELARQRMREEDKIDRRLERERVKKMHREKKLKEKAKRGMKRNKEAEEAVLDVEDEEEQDPLSFIPDPDKVYKAQQSSSDDEDGSSSSSEDEGEESNTEQAPLRKRRKRQAYKTSDDEDEEDTAMDTGLSLADDEALALQLLQS